MRYHHRYWYEETEDCPECGAEGQFQKVREVAEEDGEQVYEVEGMFCRQCGYSEGM